MTKHSEKFRLHKQTVVASIICIIIGFVMATSLFSISKITPEQVSEKAENFINTLLQGQASARVINVTEVEGLYKFEIVIDGKKFDSYMSKDGKLLFPTAYNLEKEPEKLEIPTVNVSSDDDPFLGKENAPVVIVEFSDFQCPFCKRFRDQTFEKIKSEYIDTGKVKFVYRDFPLTSIHPYAWKAAEAAQCAHEQGKFWKYHDKLFENQQNLDVESLKKYAAELELNTSKLNSCLDSGKYEEEVRKDLEDGTKAGVTGTQAFFVNGRMISGAQEFSVFKGIIDSLVG